MISYLRGKVKNISHPKATLEVGGVGYEVHCTERYCDILNSKKGQEAELYTHYYLRDDKAELYGFETSEEKNMFNILIGISGVGPKGALNILNAAPLNMLQRAIAQGDSSVLTKVSGIGNKIAQKIVVELKDKFGKEWSALGEGVESEGDVVEALESLGYSRTQAHKALEKLPKDMDKTEDKLKEALKILGQK